MRKVILLFAVLLQGCQSDHRFAVIESSNGVFALDTKTGQLCRTNKLINAPPAEGGLPYCADLK